MSPRPVLQPSEPEDRGRRTLTLAEVKARFTAITKISARRHDAATWSPFPTRAATADPPWRPLETIGHALQRAAAENA